MRRRRIDAVESDVREVIKEQTKGILGFIIRALINKIVATLIAMLVSKGWITDPEGYES